MSHNFKSSAIDLSSLQEYLHLQLINALKKTQSTVLLSDEKLINNVKALAGDLTKVASLTETRVIALQAKAATPAELKNE